MQRFTIRLRDCRFFAYHGVFDTERRAGNEFVLNLEVSYTPAADAAESDSLDSTISYAELYEIAKEEMAKPRQLLETVAATIARRIAASLPIAERIKVRIAKTTPPISGITGDAEVEFDLFCDSLV